MIGTLILLNLYHLDPILAIPKRPLGRKIKPRFQRLPCSGVSVGERNVLYPLLEASEIAFEKRLTTQFHLRLFLPSYKGTFLMSKFRLKCHIALLKAHEKLIFMVFIPKLRGMPKKIEKIKKGKKWMLFSVSPDFPIFATLLRFSDCFLLSF